MKPDHHITTTAEALLTSLRDAGVTEDINNQILADLCTSPSLILRIRDTSYRFAPTPTITPIELAAITTGLFISLTTADSLPEWWADQPPAVRRHFAPISSPRQ